ncbi:MAG: methionine--tRNA ligase [Chlamydia sp.]
MPQKNTPKKILITAALPYANGAIHFGHLAGAYLPADFYARFQRLVGEEVCFICGSDEYGVAVALSSEIHKRTPKEHVDIFHAKIKGLFEKLYVSFDHYSRTTAPIHTETATEFFTVLYEKGLVTPIESDQLFCEEEQRFYADRYVIGSCPKCGFTEARGDECTKCGASYEAVDLHDPKTKIGLKPLSRKKTTHWYLRLDLLKTQLAEWIASKTSWKSNVINFIKSYIDELRPRAITRDMSWGIPVPLPEAIGKVLYVWFDAPIGYISATKEWAIEKKNDPEAWRRFWLEPDTKFVQFIGKDNIPFHAVIFPAMIMGQNESFKLVDELPANEFYNLQGRQFSKSDGWYVDLEEFLCTFDPELIRYTIAANAPEAQDSEFTWSDFQLKVNGDLVGKFGNFVHRTLVFAKNSCDSVVPATGPLSSIDCDFIEAVYQKVDAIHEAYSLFKIRKSSQLIMELAQLGNIYFDAKKPWVKARTEESLESIELSRNTTIALCLDCIRLLALVIQPILPKTAQKIESFLGIDSPLQGNWNAYINAKLIPGSPLIKNPQPLFQKIEDEIIQAEKEKLEKKTSTKIMESRDIQKIEEITPSPLLPEISFDEFQKIGLEVVEIVAAQAVPKSKKLVQLQVIGKSGSRQIISGILQHYQPESLIGKRVVACTNLKPSKIMGLESQGMILAASSDATSLEIIEVKNSIPGASVH